MILYGSPMSPFAARARFSFHFKGLPFEQVKPSSLGGMKSAAFLAIAPIGKIPVLELPNGFRLPESETIVEYLEDAFPDRPLRPDDLQTRAVARLIARISELYVMQPFLSGLGPMMPLSLHAPARPRDEAVLEREGAVLNKGLDHIERHLSPDGPFALGPQPTTADGALIPFLTFVASAEAFFDRPDFLSERPRLGRYLREVGDAHPEAKRSRVEVEEAMAERRKEVEANAEAQAGGSAH